MEIQAINNQTFGRGSTASREHGSKRRENIDAVLALSDNELKQAAYGLACLQTDERKHININNAALLSLPVVAGIGDAIMTRGKAFNMLGKQITGTAARVLTGAKTFARWSAGFAIAGAVVAGAVKLEENSKKVRKFVKDQPYTAFVAKFAAIGAAIYGARKGLPKLIKALPVDFSKGAEFIAKKAEKFNANKIVNRLAKAYVKTSDKMHPLVKDVGMFGVTFAPALIGGGAILHTLNHSAVRNRQAQQNYTQMKTAQAVLAQKRAEELA